MARVGEPTMNAFRNLIASLIFAPACTFDTSQADGILEESSSGFTSDDSSGAHETSSEPIGDNDGAGSGGGTGGTMPPSSMGSSDDDGEGSESSSDGSSSSDDSTSTEESTGAEENPYGDCYDGPIEYGIKKCEQSCVTSDVEDFSACAPDCGFDAVDKEWICPEGGTCLNELLPENKAQSIAPVCVIPCGDGCPGDMECKQMLYAGYVWDLCMWE